MKKFFKQFLVYGAASILGKIAAVFLLPFYTNVLTKEEYGAMAMIAAAKGIIDLFSNLNIHSGVARDYYEKDVHRTSLVSTGFFSIIFFSVIVLFFLLTTKTFWIDSVLNIHGYDKAFVIMLFTLPAGSLFMYFGILTRYKQKAVLYSIGNLLQLIIQIGLTIYLVLVEKTGISGVFYGILGGEIVGVLYFYFINKENIKFTFNVRLLKRVLLFSLPTLPAILANWIDSSLGQVLIGKYISIEDAGVYSIALRIASVFLLIQIAFQNVWSPFVYENYKSGDFYQNVIKLFKVVVGVLLIIAVHLILLSHYVVVLLSNINYIQASDYLALLTIPMSIAMLTLIVNIGPGISRNTKYISYSTMIGSVLNLLFLVLLLPFIGVVSVPLSLAVSRLTTYIFAAYYTKREIGFSYPHRYVVGLILSCAILSLLMYYVKIQLTQTILLLVVVDLIMIYILFKKYNIGQLIKAVHK